MKTLQNAYGFIILGEISHPLLPLVRRPYLSLDKGKHLVRSKN